MKQTHGFLSRLSLSISISSIAKLALLVALVVLWASPAHAAGTLKIKTPEVQERGGEWNVQVMIELPRAPATIHIPMKFTFTKTVVYERAVMEEGKEPVLNRMPLNPAPKQIVSMIVDFADPRGKVFKATNFEFPVKRSAGFFEAGEYMLQVSTPDAEIGNQGKIILKGDNPTVYRGAMNFAGPKDKLQKVNSGVDAGPKPAEDTTAANPTGISGDVAPIGSGGSMVPESAFNKTSEEEVKERPKACGCIVVGASSPISGALALFGLAGGALAMLWARRRRN